MHVRRSLAVALAAGSLLLAGCAGSDLSDASDDESPSTGTSAAADQGPVRISGQAFPEAALVAQSAATDTNAFFVTKEYSESEGVTKLSDLKGTSVVLAAAPDCEGRLDCEGGLSE